MAQILNDKVAVVTGASRGIGRGIAVKLAAEGALVVVHYGSSEAAAKEVVAEIEAAGGKAFAVQGDVSQPGAAKALFAKIDGELKLRTGSDRIDILINNAGIAPFTEFSNTDEAEFDRIFAINVRSPYFLAQEAAKRLNDDGRVINFSSVVSRLPVAAAAAYSVSKGSVDVLTRLLAAELGPRGITVNAVAPGVIETDLTEGLLQGDGPEWVKSSQTINRIGQTDDISDVVAYLVSSASRWVTGQVIEVSGGTRVVL